MKKFLLLLVVSMVFAGTIEDNNRFCFEMRNAVHRWYYPAFRQYFFVEEDTANYWKPYPDSVITVYDSSVVIIKNYTIDSLAFLGSYSYTPPTPNPGGVRKNNKCVIFWKRAMARYLEAAKMYHGFIQTALTLPELRAVGNSALAEMKDWATHMETVGQ